MSTILSRILRNISTRIMFIIYMILILLTTFFLIFGYYQQLDLQELRQQDRLKAIVASTSLSIDGDAHERMLNNFPKKDDITTANPNSDYASIQRQLAEASKHNGLQTPLYTLVFDKEKGVFKYGVRSDDQIYYLHEYTQFPEALVSMMEDGGVLPQYMSENGYWISAFYPIRNSNNEVVALLEADIEFDYFIEMVRSKYYKEALICFGVILLVALILIPNTRKILLKDQKQKELFMAQKKMIEVKNKDITDSINYALRIQSAILPPTAQLKSAFPECFVFYQPKDIVSGDFYWFETVGDHIYIAVADCTGHGVPGAMVSVICSNALDRAVKEMQLRDTGPILDKVTEMVTATFEQSNDEIRDGMDICFCRFDMKTMTLQYSGANNPLYKISDQKLEIFRACKFPIGKYERRVPYKTTTIQFQKGDVFYLFSDGFVDQFGGPKGKKLKAIPFQEILLEHHSKVMSEQSKQVKAFFNNWKSEYEQLDDVCVIGIRV